MGNVRFIDQGDAPLHIDRLINNDKDRIHQRVSARLAVKIAQPRQGSSVQKVTWRICVREPLGLIGEGGAPVEVLLIEDSPGDIRLTREAFREANHAVNLHVATDGVEAMEFLRREGAQANVPRPDLILLDLNLPKMDGHEVLAEIKKDESLKLIPTVILTTSTAGDDVAKSYQLQANCYLSKPVEFQAFEKIVASINEFWLTEVKLPSQTGAA